MPQTDDAALIDRVATGDQQAFTTLYTRHVHRIRATVARRTQDQDDAQDLVQETFIRAFYALESFKGQAAFSTWLTRIALNLCHSHMRRLQAQQTKVVTTGAVDDPEIVFHLDWNQLRQENPEEALYRKEVQTLVRQGIQALPEPYRRPVELRYLQAYSYNEVAEELAAPMGTVKIWLFRARRRLKEELQRLGLRPMA